MLEKEGRIMHRTILTGVALVAAALLLVLLPGPTARNAKPPTAQCPSEQTSASPARPDILKIETDRVKYSPAMSSTVGIGLTPIFSDSVMDGKAKFIWKTDHGVFLKWSPPDYKVIRLGRETTTAGEKIYWSLDFNEKPAPSSANISLTALWNGREASSSLEIIVGKDGVCQSER